MAVVLLSQCETVRAGTGWVPSLLKIGAIWEGQKRGNQMRRQERIAGFLKSMELGLVRGRGHQSLEIRVIVAGVENITRMNAFTHCLWLWG